MEFFELLFLLITTSALVSLLIGLYKPWVVLWWEDVQNRKKVIQVYGVIVMTGLVGYWISTHFSS